LLLWVVAFVMRMRKLAVDSCAAVQVWPHASPVDPSVYVATVVLSETGGC
jgi:hypothetical protein